MKNFEKKFKDLADSTEISYDPQDWKDLSARLQNTPKKWTIWKKMSIVAAVLLLLCIPTYLMLDNYTSKNIIANNQISNDISNNIQNKSNQKNKDIDNNFNQNKKINPNPNSNENNLGENNLTQQNQNSINNNNSKIKDKIFFAENNFIEKNKGNLSRKNNDLSTEKKSDENKSIVIEKENKNKFEVLENNILSENYITQNINIEYNASKEEEEEKLKKENCFGMINSTKTNGVQVGFLANISREEDVEEINPENVPILQKRNKRTQIAGLVNYNTQDYQDKQISLLGNKANKITKLQTSILFNNTKILEGTQIGLVNRTRKMKGRQFGLINIMDSVQGGTPIGLITIVKYNGYQQLEINLSEVFQTNLSYKLGTKKFYNIFSIATGYTEPDIKWAIGYGFGRKFEFNKKTSANLDFTMYHLNKGERWVRELNDIFQLKFNYHIKATKNMTFFVGPSLNVLISDVKSPDLNFGGFTPYTISQGYIGNTSIKSWLGGNIGISF